MYWSYENSLHLYPNPHAIIIGDRHDPYDVPFAGALCMNPGAFAVNNYSFMTYFPATKTVDTCEVGQPLSQ